MRLRTKLGLIVFPTPSSEPIKVRVVPATPRPKPTTSSRLRQRLLEREDSQTKVLIVDPSRIDAERSRMELQRAGVANDFRVVSTLDELRASVVSFAPDVVISELSFSDFDGYAAQRVVEELRPDTPLIFISDVDEDTVAAKVAASGAIDYIHKSNLVRLPNTVAAAAREAREQRHYRASSTISCADVQPQRRWHSERLDAVMRIVNKPHVTGPALYTAMLQEASGAMRPGQTFEGTLGHIEGSEFVIDAASTDHVHAGYGMGLGLLGAGSRIDVKDTLNARDLAKGRTQSWEDCQNIPVLPARLRLAGLRSQIMTQFTAHGVQYVLTLRSMEPPSATPFSSEDYDYIEAIASLFARHLELEAIESEFEHAEDCLGDAEARARQHASRLEALWRISNNPSLQGADVIVAMLQHGAAAIRPSQQFIGLLGRIEGDEVSFVAEDSSPDDATAQGMFRVGVRVPLDKTLIPRVDRTRAWEDLTALGDDVPVVELARGWRSLIVTIFDAGGARYALGFASDEPMQSPFGREDVSYLEVLASSFAGRLQVDDLESSLRDAEERSRQHAERLEALWQIINSSNHNDDELVLAMLQQATTTIQPGQAFEASLLRVDGDSVIVEAVTGSPDTAPGELHLHLGGKIPLESTSLSRVLAEGGGTRSWDDIETSPYSSAASRQRGTRAVVITTFIAGDTTWALVFTSTRTTSRRPLGPQDHAYVEVLASFFANHLQQKWQFDRMAHQQSHDTLTGLLNRSTFRSQARAAALASEQYAMILVDVDDLHEINESYGHTAGDALLAEIAHSLRGRAHADDIVGRIGGDVFGIFIREQGPAEHLLARVLDFGDVFARPFAAGAGTEPESGGRATFINRTACIGVASAPEDGTEFEAILSRADAALFTAKERGHGSTVFYIAGMEAEAQRRTTLHNELREAIANDQFTLYYQPHVEMATGRVSGCEALIRWNHPERGVVLPGDFIPFAEQTGMITAIDAWVMRTAFEAARQLGALWPGFRLYFNLSGRQASDPTLIRSFIDAARSGLPLANIGVEITETDAMRDVASTRLVCRALRRLDVRIAIDDFGTGYSSLSSLKRLPVDVVKIDRSFVSGVLHDPHDATITETIVAIADQFGFATLAEGVEEPAERDWLQQRGCRYMQGFAVCHPLPLDALVEWLTEHAPEAGAA
jgi:diguanylate cyclase (GGDEF)-like protein